MKATILYDNTTFRKDLQADWGFSALIEAKGKRILFDTGGSGSILLSNMRKLEIAPNEIDEVFISHAHFDHTGGLSAFLNQNNDVKVWIPPTLRGVKKRKRSYCNRKFPKATRRDLFHGGVGRNRAVPLH